MSTFHIATENGSTSTQMVAVPSQQQSTIRRYIVPVDAEVQMSLTGYVKVYATSKPEAADKVRTKVDDGTLDDLEMQDMDETIRIPYGGLKWWDSAIFDIDTNSIEEDDLDEVTEADVLRADVKELEARISWDAEALTKRKAFLERLMGSASAAA